MVCPILVKKLADKVEFLADAAREVRKGVNSHHVARVLKLQGRRWSTIDCWSYPRRCGTRNTAAMAAHVCHALGMCMGFVLCTLPSLDLSPPLPSMTRHPCFSCPTPPMMCGLYTALMPNSANTMHGQDAFITTITAKFTEESDCLSQTFSPPTAFPLNTALIVSTYIRFRLS